MLPEHLKRMVAAAPCTARGLRDRALLTVGWSGAFRRSELAQLTTRDVRFEDDGSATVHLVRSKRDPEGQGERVLLEPARDPAVCPIRALQQWRSVLRRTQGPLFRPVPHDVPLPHALTDRAVDGIVRTAAKRAGLAELGLSAQAATPCVAGRETCVLPGGHSSSASIPTCARLRTR